MIKTILKLGFFVVVGLLGYNYFFGDETEKAQSREIVGKARDLGKDALDLLKSERQKMKEGKYDDALEKLDGVYSSLKAKASDLQDSGLLDRIQDLDSRRAELEADLKATGSNEPAQELKRQLEDLTAKTEELVNEMETQSKAVPR